MKKGCEEVQNNEVMKKKKLMIDKKTGVKKYKITRLRTLIESAAKSRLGCFLAVQDSSIGDLVTHSLTH